MYVIKRSGVKEEFMINKVINRITRYNYDLNIETKIVLNLNNRIYSGIKTAEIDNLISEIAIKLNYLHPNYTKLASNVLLNNIYKQVEKSFSGAIKKIYELKSNEAAASFLSKDAYQFIQANGEVFDSKIDHENDLCYDYFSLKALELHLIKKDGKIAERPQHLLMRTAIGIHKDDIESVIQTYKLMSKRLFMHDSNTLSNACTIQPVLSSSHLLTIKSDSLPGIYDTLKQTAIILKKKNDIGLNVHCIRSVDSYIAGSNGYSNGLVPMLKVFNESSNYLYQNDHKKAYTIYLEPWHADIFEFLDLKKNTGESNLRAKDLFYALWIPDLFMERVKNDETWSLMCPHQSPGLQDRWGDEFVELYEKYENERKYRRQVKARELWNIIINSQIENGMPYMCYKDHCNRKSNQQNLGTIKCSNSNTGIIEYSSNDEIAVSQIASIALNKFVDKKTKTYDFKKLKDISKVIVKNLNKIIDVNYYSLPEAEKSNKRHRPIGISVQGLADAFILMRYAFDSDEARKLNIHIFETIYYGALEASCELAQKEGTYETYEGSPVSEGILQYDMWNVTPTDLWNWQELKSRIKKFGLRNSLLISPLCSELLGKILGCNQCCDPILNNINVENLISSDKITIINQHLLNELIDHNLWNDSIIEQLLQNNGSIQNINLIPTNLKTIYKTSFEIAQKTIVNMSLDRAAFIDQNQPLNIFIKDLSITKLQSMHFYAWEKGLKTSLYQLHSSLDIPDNLKFDYFLKTNDKKPTSDKKSLCTREKQFRFN